MGEGTFTGKKSGESLLRREARMPWAQDALERRTHKSRAEACCAWMREWRGAQDALERPTYGALSGVRFSVFDKRILSILTPSMSMISTFRSRHVSVSPARGMRPSRARTKPATV